MATEVRIINRNYVSSSASNFTTEITEEVLYEGEDIVQIVTSNLYPMEGSRMYGNSAFILTGRSITKTGNALDNGGRGCVALATFTYTLSTEVKRKYAEEPWELGAQNVNGSYSSVSVPLTKGWDIGGHEMECTNTVGDPITATTSDYIQELHFTYCQKANETGEPEVAEVPSRNAGTIRVAGCTIPAKCGKIMPQTYRYIAEYKSDGEIYRAYWEIDTTILIRKQSSKWSMELFNVGTRAKFKVTIDGKEKIVVRDIWKWFKWEKGKKNEKVAYGTKKDAEIAKDTYGLAHGRKGTQAYDDAVGRFPIERVSEPIPLTEKGYIDTDAIENGKAPYLIDICDCDTGTWNNFRLPKERA